MHSDVFRRILQAMELASKPPEVEVKTVSGVRGMDFLHEILTRDETEGDLNESF